jgi:pimeloyl-ACP methyl ester carboxylesterase
VAEPQVELREHDGIAYREALPAGGADDAPVALLVHGYPESSYMWRHVLSALGEAGWRAIAPDLLGFGDTAPDPPSTWERQVEAIDRLRTGLGIEHAALVVHDWGGLIGLRWACDHPGVATAIVISSTGFFSDGKWHGMAKALRTEGQGEQLVEAIDRDGFGAVLKQSSAGMTNEALDEYFKAYGDGDRRRGQLELYRSGDFEKLQPYEGKLAALGLPVLLLWGEDDPFAPVAGAKRFEAELPDTRLVVIEGAGHFVVEDAPERYAREAVEFLQDVARS